MLNSLILFVLYSIPPLAGWWLCCRQPLGRRKFSRSIVILAPVEAVWRRLDPRSPDGGWTPLQETQSAEVRSEAPLTLVTSKRPRQSYKPYARVEEVCDLDQAARRITRAERGADGVNCEIALTSVGDATRLSILFEQSLVGLLAYELTRLSLKRDLEAFADSVVGRDAKSAPMFRLSGWRLAIAGVVSGFVMVALILAPAIFVALNSMGVSFAALSADPVALGFCALFLTICALYLTTLLIAVTLVHEMGHAMALAAFGHRGVTVSLIPFGGAVAMGARDHANTFEAGVVSLAGLALSALAAFALMPAPARLSALMKGVANSVAPDYFGTLLAFSGAVFAFLTLIINIPNILPWTGSDGALTIAAIFSGRRLRLFAAGLVTALLALVFAGVDDLLPFGLLFLALSWRSRKRADAPTPVLPEDWRRIAIACGFALVVGLYAHEAAMLQRVEWTTLRAPDEKVASGFSTRSHTALPESIT